MLQRILKLIQFSAPLCASMLINMISGFISMIFLGHLGEAQIAAGALAIPTYITFTMFTPIFYAVGILISYQRGQGNEDKVYVGKIVKNGFWLALTLMLPSCLLLWNASKFLLLFGQDPKLVALTVHYFHLTTFSIPSIALGYVILQFYTGLGHPRFNMIISLFSLPATVLFSYLFILGKYGFPELGLAGMGAANIIVQTSTFLGVVIFMFLRNKFQEYRIFSGSIWPDFLLYKNIWKLGFPIGVQFGGELAAMTASTYMMGLFGATALAASQITAQYTYLVVMVTLGISQALSILVSEAYGKLDQTLIKQYVAASLYVITVFFVIVLFIFMVFPSPLAHVFLNIQDIHNARLLYLTRIFFIIIGVVLYVDGIRNLFSSALRGLHDSKAPMYIGIAGLWLVSIPMNYVTGFLLHGGPIGMRIGWISGFLLASFLLWKRVKRKVNLVMVHL